MEIIIQSLYGLRWQDIFDILLNSYILFRLYVLFRGTNVIRMLAVISALWVLERMASSIGLIVTSWAIQGIIALAALIVIIVFRNEIASVFKARSISSVFWGSPRRQTQTPIEIVAESAFELVRHNLGALLVLPLKKGIEDVVHGGVTWQGKLSSEMLLSIFWNGTPVHDGATIIQGDQIVEAGAILPLSTSNTLPSHFGTRHRAAAGLTEQTDAMVIVVSEERGEVTVFKDQQVISVKDAAELLAVLQQYAGTASATNGARNQAIEFTLAGVICLASVTGVWFSFARGYETLATLEIPLEFMNRDPKMEIFSTSASTVKLQISGSGSLVKAVRPDQVKVKLDLAKAVAGDNQVPITRDGIVLPPGIELKQLEPQEIDVNLDLPAKKNIAVQPDWTGKLAPGLIVKEFHTDPETVTVIGGSMTLKDLKTIYTGKIPLNNIAADGEVTADLVLLPSSLKLENDSQKTVHVRYTIAKRASAANAESR